ncbi:MAG: amino acid permease, partial [Desulfohalobiaceae bacterium]
MRDRHSGSISEQEKSFLHSRPWRQLRPFSSFDGFVYAVFANSIVIAAALTYSLTWPWHEANIPLGIVMVCLAFVPMFTVYALLTTIMPRPGGDYVWQTRILGGFWGVTFIVTPLVVGPWFYMASNVAPGSVMVVAPLLISLSHLLNAPSLVDMAISISTPQGTWWFYVFYVTFAAAVMLRGMGFYARFQRWSFAVGVLVLCLWMVLLLGTGQEEFGTAFNRFMLKALQWGDGQALESIMASARSEGFTPLPLSQTTWRSSFLIGPALAYTFMYIAWTGTLAGEIRGVKRFSNSAGIYLGGNVFAMLVCAGFMWLLITTVGNELFSASNFLWATGKGQQTTLPPHLGLFLMALGSSPWYWLLVALGLNAWFWIWPTNNMVMSTRVMLAMSNDRLLPALVARKSRRLGVPVVAIAVCYLGALLFGWLYFFTGFARLTLDMPFMTSIAFAASTLAGTLLPFLKKTRPLYESSPV